MPEELQLDTIQGDRTQLYNDYAYEVTFKGNPFWIVYDSDAFKKAAGFEKDDYAAFEAFLDELYDNNWGYEDSWRPCDYCGEAIYTDDYTHQDYWVDYDAGCFYCADCIRNNDSIARDYLEWLTNSSERCNDFLSDSDLERLGLIKIQEGFESGYYGRNDSPARILIKLLEKYPNGQFIFSFNNKHAFGYSYDVWAFPGYEEGAREDEEE